jgi:hypothetical protein
MGPDGAALRAPPLHKVARLKAAARPVQAEACVPEAAFDRSVGSVLPRLARLDQRRADPVLDQPPQKRLTDEYRSAVGAQMRRGAVHAAKAGQHIDHPSQTNRAGDVDRGALVGEPVGDRTGIRRRGSRAERGPRPACRR